MQMNISHRQPIAANQRASCSTRRAIVVQAAKTQPARKEHKAQAQSAPRTHMGTVLGSGILAASLVLAPGAFADLNRFEQAQTGEFDVGSARQYGEATLDDQDVSNQDLRRSNFTSASCKRAKFMNSNLQGAYFIKSVIFKADFTGANLDDTLMDRAVINEAVLRNATLQRAVLTRSDLGGADIYGADFTNALLDRTQQLALCKYADGVNPVTGVSTRKSLGCGSARRFKAMSPSNPDGPQVSRDEQDGFRKTLPAYQLQ